MVDPAEVVQEQVTLFPAGVEWLSFLNMKDSFVRGIEAEERSGQETEFRRSGEEGLFFFCRDVECHILTFIGITFAPCLPIGVQAYSNSP